MNQYEHVQPLFSAYQITNAMGKGGREKQVETKTLLTEV